LRKGLGNIQPSATFIKGDLRYRIPSDCHFREEKVIGMKKIQVKPGIIIGLLVAALFRISAVLAFSPIN